MADRTVFHDFRIADHLKTPGDVLGYLQGCLAEGGDELFWKGIADAQEASPNRRADELDASGPQGAEPVACWRVTFAGSGPPRIWQDGRPDTNTIAYCERYDHRIEYAYTRPPVASAPGFVQVATVDSVDEYGPCLSWSHHWVEHIGAGLFVRKPA